MFILTLNKIRNMSNVNMIKSKTTSFKSFNCDRNPEIYCNTKITVKYLKYEHEKGTVYVDISYNYSYSNKHPKILNKKLSDTHPFYACVSDIQEQHTEGDIVRLNNMIEEMITILFLEDSVLEEQIGRTFPDDYKKGVMRSLGPNFWD